MIGRARTISARSRSSTPARSFTTSCPVSSPKPRNPTPAAALKKMGGVALRVVSPVGWLDQVLEDFERACLRNDLRPNTVRIYRGAIQDLFAAMRAAGMTDI